MAKAANRQNGLSTELRRKLGSHIQGLIDASGEHQRKWRDRGRSVMHYYHYGSNDREEYRNTREMNPAKMFHKGVLNKTFEAVSVLGPLIYPRSPTMEILPDQHASERDLSRYAVDERYLNHIIRETHQGLGLRRSVIPVLAYGRGVVRPGVEIGFRKLIGSRFYDPESYYFDPTAREPIDITWKAVQEKVKRHVAQQQYPEAAEMIAKIGNRSDESGNETVKMVQMTTFWTTLPITAYESDDATKKELQDYFKGEDRSRQPLKYIVVSSEKGEDAVVARIEPWDVPLYVIDQWPLVTIDAYEDEQKAGCLPVSPLFPGITYQVAMNKVSSLLMSQFKDVSKVLFARASRSRNSQTSEKANDRIAATADSLMLEISGGANPDIRRAIQQLKWDYGFVDAAISMIEYWESKYVMITGVHEYLQTGDPNKQDRSATATEARQRAAYTRVNDLRERVVEAENTIARINAISLRYRKDQQHIDAILGPEDAQAFGYLATEEEQNPAFWLRNLLLPMGGEQALAMMNEQQRMQLLQQAQQKAADAYTMKEVYRMTSFRIRTGSDVIPDRSERLAHLERRNNQLIPTMMQDPDPMIRAAAFEEHAQYNRELGYEDLARNDEAMAQYLRDQAQQAAEAAAAAPPEEAAPAPTTNEGSFQ